jgi:hypothetical protein
MVQLGDHRHQTAAVATRLWNLAVKLLAHHLHRLGARGLRIPIGGSLRAQDETRRHWKACADASLRPLVGRVLQYDTELNHALLLTIFINH